MKNYTVDVFPLMKKSAPVYIKYDTPDRSPFPKQKCASIDAFPLVRHSDKIITQVVCSSSRYVYTQKIDLFPLIKTC